MDNQFDRTIGGMIYRRPSNYERKKEIPSADEVQSYDATKSLIDNKFARTRQRRNRHG